MNRIFIKRIFPFVLAAGLVLGLGGCSQRVPEQGDVPDSIDELSEGMTSDKEEEPQQLEPPQEQSLQQSNEEKTQLQDQLAGEKPENKPEEEEPAKEMEVVKTSFVEKRVYGVCHLVSHAEYGSERIGTGAKMGDFPKEFHRMSFLLQRVGHGIGKHHTHSHAIGTILVN